MFIIYLVKNKINGKKYIGFTSQFLKHRMIKHFSSAKHGSPYKFHRAIRKYGKEMFLFSEIFSILTTNKQEIKELELHFIQKYDTLKEYNSTEKFGGVTYHTQETKKKMSRAWTKERKKKLIERNKSNSYAEYQRQSFTVRNPQGLVVKFTGLNNFAKENGLSPSGLSCLLSGKRDKYRDWTRV